MTDTSEQLAQARDAAASVRPHSHNSYLISIGERDGTDIVQAALAALSTPRQLDAEVVARVQKQVEYVETHSLVIPCRLSLSDVQAMLEALA